MTALLTAPTSLKDLFEKVRAGERLTPEDGTRLLEDGEVLSLGELAHEVRLRKHPEPIVTYIIDRNINPTNICVTDCLFCAFYRKPGDEKEGYVLPRSVLYEKIEQLLEIGGVQLLMQGGHHPQLKVDWYAQLFRDIKERYPVHIHGLSPSEVDYIAKRSKLPLPEAIRILHEAGLDSIPGAGAEILVDRVRRIISPKKIGPRRWLSVMREAHRQGMRTTATMMFGHVETLEERIQHLEEIRSLQDETGGFTAFIPWTCQPRHTPMEELMGSETATAIDYLKTLAVARIYLDNIDNFQASWVTQGGKIAQVSLHFGVNDFGSVMMEENVVSQAGASFRFTRGGIEDVIRAAGFEPRRRNMYYEILP
ncbi:MAG: cyclic dehypoxanthinyl futalosine synthase [Planctomycetota bacterium]